MKKPTGKVGCAIYIIAFFFIAAIIYGIFVYPFTEHDTPNQPLGNVLYTDTPTQETMQVTLAPTQAPTAVPTDTPVPTVVPTDTPAPTEPPTLKQGDKGQTVKQIQERLISLGYLSGSADGDFGRKTTQAVKDFQVCNSLKEDGIFGQACWNKMFSGYSVISQETVYVSKNGIYHTDEHCSGMKTSTKMLLSDAIRKGYSGHHCH